MKKLLVAFALWILRKAGYVGAFNVDLEKIENSIEGMQNVHLENCIAIIDMDRNSYVSHCTFSHTWTTIRGVKSLSHSVFTNCVSAGATVEMS